MSATIYYDNINQLAQITATFTLNGAAADPTVISLVVTDPVGVQVTYAVTAGQITRTGTGVYTCSISCAPSTAAIDGLWSYVWIGTGAVSDVQPGTWRVLPTTIGTWYVGLEEMKDRMGITDSADDSAMQTAILAASSWVNEYCIIPSMRVLTADLRWVPAGDLVPGQELIGVDEEPTGNPENDHRLMRSNRNRFYRRAQVLATPRRRAECIRLTMADGREVTCATDHRWLVRRFLTSRERAFYSQPTSHRNTGYQWVHTRDIRPGDDIASPLRVWPEETSFEAGWVSGLFDGEGWLSGQAAAKTNRIGIGQNQGPVLDGLLKYLDNTEIPYTRDDSRPCVTVEVGTRWAAMEVMGRLRPRRLISRASVLWEGGRVIRNGPNNVRVTAVEPAGVQEVISLSTSTGTYITEGLISHNCGQHFNRITETRTFVPHDLWIMDIDPLVSVTAVNIDRDGDGNFEESWTQNVDYQLLLGTDSYNVNALGIQRPYKKIQVIQTGKWFPFLWPYTHWDRTQVVGTWGWPSVPPPVAEAVRILAALEFKAKDAPLGVAGISDLGLVHIQSSPWLVENLRSFINPRKKVGC